MNRTRRNKSKRKKIKNRKTIKHPKKWTGGKSSMYTVRFPNKTEYHIAVEKDSMQTSVAKNKNKYDEEHAMQLIKEAIPNEYLINKSFQFGALSFEDFLKRSIVATWNKMPQQPSFDMLLRSAKSICTQEVITSVLEDISQKIHSNTNTILINENELSKQTHEYNKYIPFIEKELSDEDKVLDPSSSDFIPKFKRIKFVEIAYILATGFINALAKTWVEPEDWMERKIRPRIKVGQLDRFLCKKTDEEKRSMTDTQKQRYATSILNELLGV